MNSPTGTIRDPEDTLTYDEGVKVLWEWRRYRNEVFWRTSYRFGAAIALISIAPYLLPDLIKKLGPAVLIFPALGCLLAVFASWLMAIQYRLYKQADRKFRSLLGRFNTEDIPNTTALNRFFRIPIVKILVAFFLGVGLVGEFINGWILAWLVRRP